jgi:hypothetical protein
LDGSKEENFRKLRYKLGTKHATTAIFAELAILGNGLDRCYL